MKKVKVLFVCTGNICRSPTAEGVLRKLVAEAGLAHRIEVDSAGTHGYHVGDPPDPRAIRSAALRGYDLSDLRARRVERGDFERFDLLISMDRGHHEWLLELCPDGQFHRLRLFQDFAEAPDLLDVPDPYYGEVADYELALDMIEPGARGLLQALERDLP
jgi:protein-tyrosine phosphatase